MMYEFDAAVVRIAQVVMFENWLRFYFISEDEHGRLFIRLPEKAMNKVKKEYAAFYGLAERLNDTEIDHQTSLKEVCLFVASELNGQALSEEMIGRVFDSAVFQIELQLFSSWVQAHEEQLDSAFIEFKDWLKQYNLWKQSDEVENYRKKIAERIPQTMSSAPETIQ